MTSISIWIRILRKIYLSVCIADGIITGTLDLRIRIVKLSLKAFLFFFLNPIRVRIYENAHRSVQALTDYLPHRFY